MDFYSNLKNEEIPTHLTIWMDLEDVMLREISQLQKDSYCTSPQTPGIYMLYTDYLCPSQIRVLKPNLQCDGI